MNNEKISGFKRNHAGGDEKLVVNKGWPNTVIILSFCCLFVFSKNCHQFPRVQEGPNLPFFQMHTHKIQ